MYLQHSISVSEVHTGVWGVHPRVGHSSALVGAGPRIVAVSSTQQLSPPARLEVMVFTYDFEHSDRLAVLQN